MNVTINGEHRRVEEDATVASVIDLLAIAPGARGVAVALDGEVVTRSRWPATALRDGSRVEIVAAIQGG